MLRRQTKNIPGKFLRDQRGSVTAELAMALPAVALVIAITLSAFSLQIERMKLVNVSASAARAFARGESEANIRVLIQELIAPVAIDQISWQLETRENTNCVFLARSFELPGLPGKVFELGESQCARKVGL